MAERATGYNPAVLIWARERAGMTIDQVAAKIKKDPETLREWEAGKSAPTYLQLEHLAEEVYHRPIALLFFPAPPDEPTPTGEFRTVPEFDLDSLAPDTHFAIRDGRAYLASIRELAGGRPTAERLITADIRANLNTAPADLAARVRAYLGISVAQQVSWPHSRDAMATWRDAIESVGVFVIKRSFKQEEVAGFCFFDASYPLIIVNNSHPFTRQIFTLFHELAHLLFGVSTIAKTGHGYVDRFAGDAQRMEVLCNRFAAEFLVPDKELDAAIRVSSPGLEGVLELAARFKVSREVILRRFLDKGRTDAATYRRIVDEWAEEGRGGGEAGGGNYYATKASYLGKALLALAFDQFHAGRITSQQLSEHLDIKARNLGKLEEFLLGRS